MAKVPLPLQREVEARLSYTYGTAHAYCGWSRNSILLLAILPRRGEVGLFHAVFCRGSSSGLDAGTPWTGLDSTRFWICIRLDSGGYQIETLESDRSRSGFRSDNDFWPIIERPGYTQNT